MALFWYVMLGVLLAGYFALAGYDYGVGLALPSVGRDETGRRQALNAIGPFFLGNEVWIVAAVGVLLAAFPHLEGVLFSSAYPLVGVIVAGLLVVNAAVQLRGRLGVNRRAMDALIVIFSVVLALAWGMLLGNLLGGLPSSTSNPSRLFDWYFPWLCGLALMGIIALHGGVFLAWRGGGPRGGARGSADPVGQRARRQALRLLPVTGALVVLSVIGGLASRRVRLGLSAPVPAVALAVALLVLLAVAGLALWSRRLGVAFAATTLTAALPVILVGVARYPRVLPGLTVEQAAAGGDTLRFLTMVGAPVLPVLFAVQVLSWWIFRDRPGLPRPSYW